MRLLSRENFLFKNNSYSQTGEDIIIRFIFLSLKIDKPTYIDIGAHHPFYLSNTALLYENGSNGINIEPDSSLIKLFNKYRKRDINLNIGISDIDDVSDFYIMNVPTLNTFSKKETERYSNEGNYFVKDVKKMHVIKFNELIDKYANGSYPDFLNIDAEGVDEIIIKSIDFKIRPPIVICIETISFSTNGMGSKNNDLISYIKSKGYILFADTYINSIFVLKSIWERGIHV
jgi:hypothetical protein